MYDEFRKVAHEDASRAQSDTGMKHLLSYYKEALSNKRPMAERVARHYAQMVQNEDRSSDVRPVFEQLKRQWRDGATDFKNRNKIGRIMEKDIRRELDR